jgi:hypothetical protein
VEEWSGHRIEEAKRKKERKRKLLVINEELAL